MDFELLKKCVDILANSEICKYQKENIKKHNLSTEKVEKFCFDKLMDVYFSLKKELSSPH